jgi:Tfp pilus assembly protein PilO
MNKLSKEKQQQLILVAILAVGLSGALWYLVISDQQENLKKVQKQTKETREKVDKADQLVKSKDKVQSELDTVAKRLETLEEGLASGDLYNWALVTITKFKAAHRVTINNVTREELLANMGLLPGFPYKAAKFTISGSGFFQDLGNFVADFENTYPYFRIQNLDLAPMDNAGPDEGEKLGFRMEIVTLIKSNPAAK